MKLKDVTFESLAEIQRNKIENIKFGKEVRPGLIRKAIEYFIKVGGYIITGIRPEVLKLVDIYIS